MSDKKQPNSATYEQLKLISVRMNLTAPEVMALTDVQVATYLSELEAIMTDKRPLNYNQNISNMLDTSAAIKEVAAQKQGQEQHQQDRMVANSTYKVGNQILLLIGHPPKGVPGTVTAVIWNHWHKCVTYDVTVPELEDSFSSCLEQDLRAISKIPATTVAATTVAATTVTYESPAAEDAQVFYDQVASTVRALRAGDLAALGYDINKCYQQCNDTQFKYLLDALLAAKQATHGKE